MLKTIISTLLLEFILRVLKICAIFKKRPLIILIFHEPSAILRKKKRILLKLCVANCYKNASPTNMNQFDIESNTFRRHLLEVYMIMPATYKIIVLVPWKMLNQTCV